MTATRNYTRSTVDKWEMYDRLKNLHENISILVTTKEVNQIQKVRLRSYMRVLRHRINKLESQITITPIALKPFYIEVGDGC